MKVFMKKMSILLCAILIIGTIFSCVNVYADGQVDFINILRDEMDNNSDDTGKKPIQQIIGTVLNVVRIVGSTVSIVVLLVIATKYIIASAGERADIKKYSINYVIGAIIFLSATGILSLIQNFMETNVK